MPGVVCKEWAFTSDNNLLVINMSTETIAPVRKYIPPDVKVFNINPRRVICDSFTERIGNEESEW